MSYYVVFLYLPLKPRLSMSKKKQRAAKKTTKSNRQKRAEAAAVSKEPSWLLLVGGILLLTFIAFLPSLSNDFINWDDGVYILSNETTQWKSDAPLKEMFTEPIVAGDNYLPLTWLSFGIDYLMGGLDAAPYHRMNLLLHLLNTFLVFLFCYRLTAKNWLIAAVTSLLFGVHPMHVESVAWIAERKDVLYTFFFMGGMLTYLRYRANQQMMWLVATFVLGLASLLSKPAAVVFPIALWLVDLYQGRKWDARMFVEKIPFLALSVVIGIVTIKIQSQSAISQPDAYSMVQRISFAGYGFMMYIAKLFVPINLSALYPYPVKTSADTLPLIFKVAPLLALVITGAFAWWMRTSKAVLFGFLFFVLNLLLVLQLLPVGNAVMADRYSYLAYVGLCFALASGIAGLYKQRPQWRMLLLGLVAVGGLVLTGMTYQRCGVWKNSGTLWSDVLSKYPDNSIAHFKRGEYNSEQKRGAEAMKDYSNAIKHNPSDAKALTNRGLIYFNQKKYQEALADFNQAIKANPQLFNAWLNRGRLYYQQKEYDKALVDYNKALEFNAQSHIAYNNRAIIYHETGDLENALKDYDKALALSPNYASAKKNRAILMKQMGQ